MLPCVIRSTPPARSLAFCLLLIFSVSHRTIPITHALTPAEDDLIHVPITRRPTPASRLYNFERREWYRHFLHTLSTLPSNATTPTAVHNPGFPKRFHIHQTQQQRQQTLPSNPLRGSITPLGEYYVTLTFGGQPINVQLDTGSSSMAVPLRQCRNCRRGDHRLDLNRAIGPTSVVSCSSSACAANSCTSRCGACDVHRRSCCSSQAKDACAFYLLYADRSGISGALVRADVGIASLVTPLVFGAILEETKSFENNDVDGIFGMAYKSLACNPSCVTPLFDALVESGKVKRDIFSICTAREGGVLTLGGSKKALYKGELSYVNLKKTYSAPMFYLISVQGLLIDGSQVDLPYFSSGIVDSGTTLLIVSTITYDALKKYFQTHFCNVPGLCPSSRSRQLVIHPHYPFPEGMSAHTVRTSDAHSWFEPGYCVNLSADEIALLPTLSIKLDGYIFEIEPQVYMIPHYIKKGFRNLLYHCLGIAPLHGLESFPNDVIIGDTVLQKYFVEYDREKGRLGFAEAERCVDADAVEPVTLLKARGGGIGGGGGGLGGWMERVRDVVLFVAFVAVIYVVVRFVRGGGRWGEAEGYRAIETAS